MRWGDQRNAVTENVSYFLPRADAGKMTSAGHLQAVGRASEAAALAAAGGGEKSGASHVSRGKMLPRERVANLLDPGSPFLEIGAAAGQGMSDGAAPCGGAIGGVGQIHGQNVMIV